MAQNPAAGGAAALAANLPPVAPADVRLENYQVQPRALAQGKTAPTETLASLSIPLVSTVSSYSILNGAAASVVPYIIQSAVADAYKWVPVNGVNATNAIRCMDGFIRSHLFHLRKNPPEKLAAKPEIIRWIGILLGAARAVITANYDIVAARLNAQEVVPPLLTANFGAEGAVSYTVHVDAEDTDIAIFGGDFTLTEAEVEVIKVVVRCAQAIVPIQGLNLINEGHHYIDEKNKGSFRAFLAVERQVWTGEHMKNLTTTDIDMVRDVLWHKAGHPVEIRLKEEAAMSPQVKENLVAAKLGSAASRLPAVETDVKAAMTFIKVADTVDALWATMGGGINTDALRQRIETLTSLKKGEPDLGQPVVFESGEEVYNRDDAVAVLRVAIVKCMDKIGTAYGFYCAMMDAMAGEVTTMGPDTLRSAFSLDRLMKNSMASYRKGVALYKDFKAMEAKRREAGTIVMPTLTLMG